MSPGREAECKGKRTDREEEKLSRECNNRGKGGAGGEWKKYS